MCVGIPMKVVSADGFAALCRDRDGATHEVDLALVGAQSPGTWVLTFLGAAQEVIDEARADEIGRALAGLASLMQGGDLGDAFADLEREPQLPPHLAALVLDGAHEREEENGTTD